MQFSKLTPAAIDESASDELRSRAENLAKRIAAHCERRAELVARAEQLQAQPAAEFEVDEIGDVSRREVALLREELRLREELADVLRDHRAEMADLRDLAFDVHRKAEEGVRKKLAKIGYVDAEPTDPSPSKIQQGWIGAHPEVMAALGRYRELADKSRSYEAEQANVAGVEEATKRLEQIRRRLLVTS